MLLSDTRPGRLGLGIFGEEELRFLKASRGGKGGSTILRLPPCADGGGGGGAALVLMEAGRLITGLLKATGC